MAVDAVETDLRANTVVQEDDGVAVEAAQRRTAIREGLPPALGHRWFHVGMLVIPILHMLGLIDLQFDVLIASPVVHRLRDDERPGRLDPPSAPSSRRPQLPTIGD